MWESQDSIEKKIDWKRPSKEGDGAWHIRIEIIDPDGENLLGSDTTLLGYIVHAHTSVRAVVFLGILVDEFCNTAIAIEVLSSEKRALLADMVSILAYLPMASSFDHGFVKECLKACSCGGIIAVVMGKSKSDATKVLQLVPVTSLAAELKNTNGVVVELFVTKALKLYLRMVTGK
nr:hypothetical protein [Tanacetum cinerariifolium]